jgi:hypothetical protein
MSTLIVGTNAEENAAKSRQIESKVDSGKRRGAAARHPARPSPTTIAPHAAIGRQDESRA